MMRDKGIHYIVYAKNGKTNERKTIGTYPSRTTAEAVVMTEQASLGKDWIVWWRPVI